ncbi:MAG: CPBP family intramembrane metalloprotease [Porphyromonas sp.]|nr:CPBP family intramembrane metalloprotease [Porphyromonas sp.]
MGSKKLYFWQALLMIYVIPVIAFTILVSCIDSPRFTSIMNQLASTTNYLSVISNLIDFGVIIFAFIHYYRLPLALGGGWNAVKPQRGQFILLCLVGVLEILVFESFAVLTGARQNLNTSLPHILSAIIVAPIVEEMFYRHVLLRLFLRTYRSPLLAILYSAILFTMLHSGQIMMRPILIVPYLTSGIVLGYLYYKSNSIWFCILMHSLTNAAGYLSLVLFF